MGFRDKFKNVFGLSNDENSIDETQIEKIDSSKTKLSSRDVLFVCMTNTVVSPIAEAIFNLFSGDREAFSAGLNAQNGNKSSQDAITVCEKYGVDLSDHITSNINDFSLDNVGLILTSTSQIRDTLKMKHSNIDIFTIKEYAEDYDDLDILDHLDGDSSSYDKCFNEINSAIIKIIRRDIDIVDEPLVGEEISEEPVETYDSINVNDNNNARESIDKPLEIISEEQIRDKEEVNVKSTQHRNFKYLDDLIHSDVKEIVLDSDIVLNDGEESDYLNGIKLDVDYLVIDGNGYAIDARRKTRIFEVTGKNIIIKNIKLKNGFTQENGGIICITEGTLTVSDSSLLENTADKGGAIFNSGKVTVSDSTLLENTAQVGGGVIFNSGKVTVSDSTLQGNTAKEYGGAIYNLGGEVTVSDSTLQGNTAKEYGGAIYNLGGEVTVSDSTLQGNTAQDGSGGIIYNKYGTLTVSDSSLLENTADEGGAIFNSGEVTVSDSSLLENTADEGGAIFNSGEVTVSDSTLLENTADEGGAIFNSGEVTVSDSTLQGNTAQDGSGGAMFNSGEVTVSDSTLLENTADNGGAMFNSGEVTVSDSTLLENTVEKDGGAIYNRDGNFKVFNCDFSNNRSPKSIIENRDSLQFFNSNFLSNHAPNIIVNDGLANVGIFNGEFKDNDINESIIFNDGKSCTAEKTIFEKHPYNTIINKSDLTLISPKIKDEGKVILNEKHILIKKSSDELEDKIYGDGKVENKDKFNFKEFDFTYLDKKIHESKNKEIILEEDISFENYEIDYYEGGIELDIDNLIIDGNGHTIDAQEKTRIFYCTGKNITIKNLTLKNGHSHKNHDNSSNNNGGAIKTTHNTELTIKNCKFINNTSEKEGGAICNNSELTVSESTLLENTAQDGSGGAIHNSGGEVTVSDSTLQGNTAQDGSGGAIHNDRGELTVSGSTLTGNTSKWDGGAINNWGTLKVYDSTLTGNTAKHYGGAIYNSGELTVYGSTLLENTVQSGVVGNFSSGGAIYNGGEVTVSDSALQGNTAESRGGAIYNDRGELTVYGSTLTGNTSKWDGGAINNWGTLTVYDSTLAENTAGKCGAICHNGLKKYESNNCTFKDNKPDDVYEQKE